MENRKGQFCPRSAPLRSDHNFGVDLRTYALHEIRRCLIAHRNNYNTSQRASEKHGRPFGRILAPEHDAITLCQAAAIKRLRDCKSPIHNLPVRELFCTVSASLRVGTLLRVCSKMFQKKLSDRFSHDRDAIRFDPVRSLTTSLVEAWPVHGWVGYSFRSVRSPEYWLGRLLIASSAGSPGNYESGTRNKNRLRQRVNCATYIR